LGRRSPQNPRNKKVTASLQWLTKYVANSSIIVNKR